MVNKYFEVGQIVSTHGIKGEVNLMPWADSPEFLKQFDVLYFDSSLENPVKVEDVKIHGKMCILKLSGVDTVEDAQKLRNKVLICSRDDIKQHSGWFVKDLIGCEVRDYNDKNLIYGKITDVFSIASNDVWTVTDNKGKEYLLPVNEENVREVSVENDLVLISPIKGIFDEPEEV
jgi:16S rRNA processing protein RimM